MPPLIPLVGTGGLFTRIGAFGGLLNAINASRGVTIPAHVAEIQAQYQSTNQDVIDNLYSDELSYQNSCSSFNGAIRSMSTNTIVEMANQSLLLANQNLNTALIYLISQMKSASQTVNQCVVSSNWSAAVSNIGNPNILISVYDVNNILCEYAFSELATAICTQDSQQFPSLAGVERLNVTTQQSISDAFSWLWPEGSGVSIGPQAVSGMSGGGGSFQNWLLNGSFETWTPTASGVPNNWHIFTGTAGSTILESSSIFYDGAHALQFAGNGSENTSLVQGISTPSNPTDTPSVIYPNTIFACNFWARIGPSAPPAGVLRVALSDLGTVIPDNSGALNQLNLTLSTLTTSWQPFAFSIRTPNYLSQYTFPQLSFTLTTPLPNTYSVYIDRVSFCQMQRMYTGGPFITFFSGNINMIRGDTFWINIFNDYGGKFQTLFNKTFGMAQLGLILPSSPSPTIPDSLIT